jgi:hypothetical protein
LRQLRQDLVFARQAEPAGDIEPEADQGLRHRAAGGDRQAIALDSQRRALHPTVGRNLRQGMERNAIGAQGDRLLAEQGYGKRERLAQHGAPGDVAEAQGVCPTGKHRQCNGK